MIYNRTQNIGNPIDLTEPEENLFELKEALIESNLPILVDVLDWALLPDAFYPEIEAQYVPVQKAKLKNAPRLCGE
ncbi:MAG: hypothetical protein Q9N68_05335 [Gammaproteobacteria bacterium]|nr:hypothetical protein [Gammaproteobacteria bacterium]